MTTIVTRAGKGSPLTNNEVDTNFTNLNDAKIETLTSTDASVTITGTGSSRNLSVPVNPSAVSGPASATDNALVRFDSTTGKLVQNGVVTEDDNGSLLNVNAIGFDTTPTSAPTTTGTMFWDSGNGTPSVVLDADVELQLGQENIVKVYNNSASTILNGSVVAVNGAQGQRPAVVLADADSEPLSAATLGIATEDIAAGAEGFVTTFGLIRGLDTSTFAAGAPIYLSQTAGQFTATRPAAPAHTVFLGWVIKVNASSGEIFVHISNGWELDELHNVLISSPTGGNLLAYDQTNQYWKNINLTDGTAISITETTGGAITIANTGVTQATAGTGISVSAGTGNVTITNTAPDQTVALTAGTGISTSGTYPNFTITNSGVTSITGTANEVDVSSSTGAITISLPATINANITGNAATATSATSATTATTATNWGSYGAVPAAGTSFGNANTIGRSDGNGYTYFNYINSNTSNSENPTVSQVIVTKGGDNFYRKASIAHLTGSLSGTAPINITGSAGSATTASTANALNTGNSYTVATLAIAQAAPYLYVNRSSSGSGQMGIQFQNGGSSLWWNYIHTSATDMTWYNSSVGANVLTLTTAGALTAASTIQSNSDERLKTNWRPVQQDFVAKLANVKSGVYDRVDQEATQVGVSAQSLQTLLPEAVGSDSEGILNVAYGNAALVSAIELAKVVEELRAEVARLKAKLGE